MKRLDSLTVYSKEELSSLWNIVKDRFPSQTVWVQKTRDGDYKLAIKKQYTEPFFKIFSKWLHQKIYQTELEKLLFDYHILSAEEHGVIFHSATEKVAESQELMISILLEKIRIITEISSHLKLEGFLQFGIEEYRQKMEDIIE
ncbi:MAG: hypothetical protein J6A56_03445, partial [Clostridia bacterium]|nr:hypothetical protein [Clostridia bacterium]